MTKKNHQETDEPKEEVKTAPTTRRKRRKNVTVASATAESAKVQHIEYENTPPKTPKPPKSSKQTKPSKQQKMKEEPKRQLRVSEESSEGKSNASQVNTPDYVHRIKKMSKYEHKEQPKSYLNVDQENLLAISQSKTKAQLETEAPSNVCSIHALSEEQKAIFLEELEDLSTRRIVDLTRLAKQAGIIDFYDLTRQELMIQVAQARIQGHSASIPLTYIMEGGGVVEVLQDGYGFLRASKYNYLPSPTDVYVSPSQIKRFNLRTGDTIHGDVRAPKEQEKFHALVKIDTINYLDPDSLRGRRNFDTLTPLFPDDRLTLETTRSGYSMRVVDMLAPIGKGQRGLIVSPPKAGKTILLKDIANSISHNHPEVKLIVLLVDERPEEVTDMERSVNGDVVASTFDEPADRHVQVAEMVLEKSKRMVEAGHDVVVLLDSITRLARAYNTVVPHSGKILSGGVDANALHKPKRFFGAARNIEFGGSLTIIATALIETGSRMDEVIFEEFKGTGNMELVLDRKLAERRLFPAIDVNKSSTRREDLLYTPEENGRVWVLRKILSSYNSISAMEFLLDRIKSSNSNLEFYQTMNS